MPIIGRRRPKRQPAQQPVETGKTTQSTAKTEATAKSATADGGKYGKPKANGARAEKKDSKRKFKIKKKHIKWYVIGGLVLALGIWVVTCTNNIQKAAEGLVATTEFTTLAYADLKNSISATGVVESADKNRVYSTMSYQVENVLVEVGDYVNEGDILLELDRASIEKQIHEKELSMEQTEKSGDNSVKSAQDTYRNYKEGIEEGTNSSLISANSSVQNAYDNYLKAIRTSENYEKSLRDGSATTTQWTAYTSAEEAYNKAKQQYDAAVAAAGSANSATKQQILDAQAAVSAAQSRVKVAGDAYSLALQQYAVASPVQPNDEQQVKDAGDAYKIAQDDLEFAQKTLATLSNTDLNAAVGTTKAAMDSALRSMQSAEDAYEAALKSTKNNLEEYRIAIDTAYTAYQTALQSRTSAEVAADNQLNAYRNSLETARIAAAGGLAEYQLEEMKKDLEKASIAAPVSGTITAVYAMEGATSSGLLFIIEDVQNLIVETSVKEYDIGTVAEGLPVSIKSDATGNDAFDGKVTRIAPAANKDTQGNTSTAGDVLFATEVEVLSKNTPLRIGMSVRLEYIVDQVQQVLSVPYDAIYENAAGQTCVMAARPQETGQMLLEEVPVTTGMENDLSIAISGDGVQPGLIILNSPQKYAAGQLITPIDAALLSGTSGSAMPGFAMRAG